ncbi:MAG: DegT/DnrJ/EryC1/StrS family aminotransferase, partial [Elusimicrobia bacterium]|nr:DegT/DnrJ/EryC1/StrS family aminotransferase [Elusimicrobiota bacterium]
FSHFLVLPEPEKNSAPSWFGFLITVKKNAGFTRDDIVKYLEANKIQTRALFAGNLIKHPCFDEMRKSGKGFRIVSHASNFLRQSSNLPIFQSSDLPVTDLIMNSAFWIGVYPGMDKDKLNFVVKKFHNFFKKYNSLGDSNHF